MAIESINQMMPVCRNQILIYNVPLLPLSYCHHKPKENTLKYSVDMYLLINLTFFEDLVGCLDRTFAFAFFNGAVFLPTTVNNADLMSDLSSPTNNTTTRGSHKYSNQVYPFNRRATTTTRQTAEIRKSGDNDHDDRVIWMIGVGSDYTNNIPPCPLFA